MSPDMTLLDRMVLAVERVRDRLLRSTGALETAGISYALVGGHAVAAWVATIDASAVRNTPDVDILLSRSDIHAAAQVFEEAGFVRQPVAGTDVDQFLDGTQGKARDAVHIVIAGEKLRAEHSAVAPNVLIR
jgi:hypothetical protein